MMRRNWRLPAKLIIFAICVLAAGTIAVRAQQGDDLGALNHQVERLYQQGQYKEATDIAKHALALAERQLGPDNPDLGRSLTNLAELYHAQGRYAEAEPLYRRALAIDEKALGPEHPNVGADLGNLGALLHTQGRYADAEPLLRRALAINEKARGGDHPSVAISLNNLAALYYTEGRYPAAEPLLRRALAIEEKALGPDDIAIADALSNIAELYRVQGRYSEAEPLLQRSLAIAEKALGLDHPAIATRLSILGGVYEARGRGSDAEPLYKRALAITERSQGPDHPTVGVRLNNLAELYRAQGRYAEAEPLYQRALAIHEKAFGSNHPEVGRDLDNLANLDSILGRYDEAARLYGRALAIDEKVLGPDHPDVGRDLNNLGGLYVELGRYGDAELLYKRALSTGEKSLGADHPSLATTLDNLAALHFAQSDWTRAVDYGRRGTSLIVRRELRGSPVGEGTTGKGTSELERKASDFWGLVKAGYRLASQQRNDVQLRGEMFQAAQWVRGSQAAQSLAQMAARGAKGDVLASLVRERQDLVLEWRKRDADRSAAVAQLPDRRNREAEAENVARLAAIDARLATIDKQLAANFPDYAALVNPAALSVEDVQRELGADEALVLFLDTPEMKPVPEETFVFVVTKDDMRWVRSELGTPGLTRDVAALRCGLDFAGAWTIENSPCPKLLNGGYTAVDHELLHKPLPFDLVRAHTLYAALFGQIEDLIKDKSLLIVPSGPLTQLPFQVLVTEPAKTAAPYTAKDYRDAPWLARKHAMTVLPAVSSLKTLRELARKSQASEPYIGFGDPLLDGDPTTFKDDAVAAKLAREKRCDPTPGQRVASFLGLRGGRRTALRSRGGVVDVADLKTWAPLPETADEVCDVARDLGVDPATHVYVGAAATETRIKQQSQSGVLARNRIVHFATHGAVSGEILSAAEPGLLLTPPDKATELDDGYLSASEVAGLKLDADWVILSACNTAAGEAKGAEALSGLARAFFYAGARSLLVSHWEVSSEPTVKLITKAVDELRRDPKLGRAEALRRSMLSMIDTGQAYEAHPAVWAPFVLVGEGGAAR